MRTEPYTYQCWWCEAENEIAAAVVDLCKEYWTSCDECGERQKLDLRTKPRRTAS